MAAQSIILQSAIALPTSQILEPSGRQAQRGVELLLWKLYLHVAVDEGMFLNSRCMSNSFVMHATSAGKLHLVWTRSSRVPHGDTLGKHGGVS